MNIKVAAFTVSEKSSNTKLKLSVDLTQLLRVIKVWGFTLRHKHKLFVEQ